LFRVGTEPKFLVIKENIMELREIYRKYKTQFNSLSTYLKKGIRYIICIFTVIIFLLTISYALQQIPHWQVSHFGITNPKDLAEIENSYRITLIQSLGGIAIGMGLYYTWRRVIIAENELKVSQQSQITERFTRAVDQLGAIDQLGNPAIEIRLGGIYALERISKESEEDYWPIIEILTAYVRKNSSFKIAKNRRVTNLAMDIQANESITSEVPEIRNISLDIQAVITVIRRRKYFFGNGEAKSLDLQETNLLGANLSDADLSDANFSEAYLSDANLHVHRPLAVNII
jgi:Uncharacterized low-complexity proteins